ncbi:hypothetical protein D5086_026278 [Populus alba]|uniref:Uncharacterized protein n=1 Tax=Populus alba TaxID=43335 RepID=A0ACC4B1Y2_POPAL|nr:uncharacterized protein LOC118041488 isoform X1 [Populus alba]
MEKLECPCKHKHRKNKAQITINIGGSVVLGGVFVVTSLIAAAFAVKRRRRRDTDKEGLPCKKEAKGTRGLCYTLENPSSTFHQNPCLTDGSTGMAAEEIQVDFIELVSTESLILEENSASMINDENDNFTGDDQELLLADDTRQEIMITSFDICCGMEELPLLVLDSESMNAVEGNIKNDSEDNSSWLERIEIKRQEEEVDSERIMEEETKSVNLVEEDEEGYSGEEYVMEEEAVGAEKMTAETTVAVLWVEDEEEDSSEEDVKDEGDESSEETGSTSAETNAEVIWPAESIEVLSLELKNIMINTQSLESKEKIVEEDGSTKIEELEVSIEALPSGCKEHLGKPAKFIIIN